MSEVIGPNGQQVPDDGKQKPEQPSDKDRELTLIITMKIVDNVYQPVGIKKESNAIENEMASIFMLEKAKDIVKILHTPRVVKANIQPKGGIMNFARKLRR